MSKSASRARLAEIIRKRSFGRGEITLASGRKSDFYINLKPTMLDPEGAALLAELTFEALKDDSLDYVGGLEMGAVPIAGAIAQLSWLKGHPIAAFFVRKKPKEHGARLAVEGLAKGETLQGKRVVIVEDVTTTGGSAIKAVDAVRDAGGEIALVFTMVDREEGATENFAQAGLAFRSLYKASEFFGRVSFSCPGRGAALLQTVHRRAGTVQAPALPGHTTPAQQRTTPRRRALRSVRGSKPRISFRQSGARSPLVYHPVLRLLPDEARTASPGLWRWGGVSVA